MATTDSVLNLRGSIKGLRFYRATGCSRTIVGTKGGANINLIRNHRVFQPLREAQVELRGRAKCAKDIRYALGDWSGPIVDRHLQARLAGLLMQVIKIDVAELRGSRSIRLSLYKEVLDQINYYYYKSLAEVLRCPYNVESSEDRRSVRVTIKGLHPKMQVKAPLMASHFQLCLSIGTIADFEIDQFNKKYSRPYGEDRNRYGQYLSEWIPINNDMMDEISLSATLPDAITLNDKHTVVRAFGIVFGKMMREVEPLARDRGSIVFLGAV